MRILILSATPWSSDNSFGNTFTNLFSDLPDIEIANIYTRYGMPDNNGIVSRYFQITESDLLHKSPGRSFSAGCIPQNETADTEEEEKSRYDFVRKHRLRIFFFARELIWKFGKWNTSELRKFIDEFAPDLIYLPIYYEGYLLDIGYFLKTYTGVRMIGHVSDDLYSLRQFSISPFYWIDRFWKRGKVRKIVGQCEFLHVITEKQKEEYERLLHVECRVFRKSLDFDDEKRYRHEVHDPICYVYTGHLGSGRWRMLSRLGRVLDRYGGELFVYSATPLNRKMKKEFSQIASIRQMGAVPAEECMEIQKKSDVLVLVESVKMKDRLLSRLSLSSKVVDYLNTGNCILAIGPGDQAGMEYLRNGNAAVCVDDISKLAETVKQMDKNVIYDYGERAWQFGKRNHSKKKVKEIFYSDLKG